MPVRVSPAKTPLDSTRDYKISSYGLMLSDKVRVSAYAEALRRTVTPEAIVLDLGSGVGIFALLACRLGARRVYGIERQDVVALSKRIADANALSDRIEFIQGTSTDVRLPETADIVISDMRGVLPLFESHVPSIIDARSRFLSPGGTLIPSRDFLWVSVVEVPDLYDRYMGVWCADSYGLNLELGRREAANVVLKERLTVDQLITEPRLWATLQYD
jgi:protein arginine N-methyltransferase 1